MYICMIDQWHDSPVFFEGVSGVFYAHVPFGVLYHRVHRDCWRKLSGIYVFLE